MQNKIKTIRENIGLGQQQLADYLGIARSTLAQAETGRRALSTDALMKLTQLYQLIPEDIQTGYLPALNPVLLKENNIADNYLQKYAKESLQKALQVKKILDTMQNNYAGCLKLLQAIKTMQQELTDTKANKKTILWLAATEAEIMQKIKFCNKTEQYKLQIQFESLQYAANRAGELQTD